MSDMIQQLPIDQLECDMQLQPRAKLHDDWIKEYAQDMASGAEFPPVIAFFDGERHWLSDGFHRCHAARTAKLAVIKVDVRHGSRRDALLHSLSANAEHGHRRTNADKQRAIDIMLNGPDWSHWSDREIAKQIGVHHDTVGQRRRDCPSVGNRQMANKRLVSHHGTTYKMDTSKIGRASNAGVEADAGVPVSLAAQVARLPEDQQRNLVDADKAVLREAVKASQDVASAVELPTVTAKLRLAPDTKRHNVLYADPWSAMTLDNLCAQPVPAADNSVLCLRAPRPDDALRLMDSWGFVYADHVVWNKGGSAPGNYVRYTHELFLIGTRGDILMPAPGTALPSILCAASDHELADEFAAMFPNSPKVELFTRARRSGWNAWQPEAGRDDVVEAEHEAAHLEEEVA
jgi:N6-adenosine-specific RNA methylase IME4